MFVLLLYSCSINKYIPEGERLYTGATIEMKLDSVVQNKDKLKNNLSNVVRPEPNSKFLGMYLGLYYYYKNKKEKTNFVSRWLYKKFGEEPVYQSDVLPLEVEDVLRNRLENNGFFYSTVNSSFIEKKNTASVLYNLNITKPYTMTSYQLDSLPFPISAAISEITEQTPFQKNMRFSLSNLKLERERIDTNLKQKGYYHFNSNFLVFEADTNQYKNKRFDLFLKLKAKVPQKAIIPYKLKEINIYPNYNLKDS